MSTNNGASPPWTRTIAFRIESRKDLRERQPPANYDHSLTEYVEQLRKQLAHWSGRGFTFRGYGTAATGPAGGWCCGGGIFYRCVLCGYLMDSGNDEIESCFCGAMHRDVGRFGSDFGDQFVEVLQSL